jgi:hypothetical protein
MHSLHISARVAAGLLLATAALSTAGADYLPVPGGTSRSVLPADGLNSPAKIAPFLLRSKPVSNAELRVLSPRRAAPALGANC